jgi:hypothetical protein
LRHYRRYTTGWRRQYVPCFGTGAAEMFAAFTGYQQKLWILDTGYQSGPGGRQDLSDRLGLRRGASTT